MVKINEKGEYTPFTGWTAISNVKSHMKFIENYLNTNIILSKYFKPLPASSYHMTLYNIWCNGRPLLPCQEEYIKTHFEQKKGQELKKYSCVIGKYFNPGDCINQLLEKLQLIINSENWYKIKLQCNSIVYNGQTLTIMIDSNDNFTQANIIRQKMIKQVGIDDRMACYHITLAYQYSKISEEDKKSVLFEINKMNIILKHHIIELDRPFIAYFNDMTKFIPCFQSIKKCIGFLVPDKHTQQQLENYGFDLNAPMRSFNDKINILEENTVFGGVHVTMFSRRIYVPNCHQILKQIVKELQCIKPWSLPNSFKINRGKYQSNISFLCPVLTQASIIAERLGWTNVIKNNYHIGLYSSTLEQRNTPEQEIAIVKCLSNARWGFILSIDNGDNKFNYDWNTFVPF